MSIPDRVHKDHYTQQSLGRESPAASASPSPSPSHPMSSSAHHHISIGLIVGVAIGGTVAVATFALALWVCLRRCRRVRELPLNDDDLEPRAKAGLVSEPFLSFAPTTNQSTTTPRKAEAMQCRVTDLHESHNDEARVDTLSHPFPTSVGATAVAPAGNDLEALRALEMRLERRFEGMMQTLAMQGETESSPPEYDEQR